MCARIKSKDVCKYEDILECFNHFQCAGFCTFSGKHALGVLYFNCFIIDGST
jgi:hypothetical protein